MVAFEYEVYADAKTLLHHFKNKGYENYILSADVGYEKPRKEIFGYAMEKAGNPEIKYMIGDNPVADYEGGPAVGMKPVLVHNKVEGKVCCLELTDLPEIITE